MKENSTFSIDYFKVDNLKMTKKDLKKTINDASFGILLYKYEVKVKRRKPFLGIWGNKNCFKMFHKPIEKSCSHGFILARS